MFGFSLIIGSTALLVNINHYIHETYGEAVVGAALHLLTGAGNGILIAVLETIYNKFAKMVVNAENHKFESHWEDSIILKEHFFEFSFHYFTLFYYAFIERNYQLVLSTYISLMISKNMIFMLLFQLEPLVMNTLHKRGFLKKWIPLRQNLKREFVRSLV